MLVYLFFIMALSFDTFIAALTYEGNKIEIPFFSNLIISGICSFSLIISLSLGGFLGSLLPEKWLKYTSFIILFILGVFKIFGDGIRKHMKKRNYKIHFFNNILNIYCDYKSADCDESKHLSKLEAVLLSIALSFDNLTSGIAFRISYVYFIPIFLLNFFVNVLSILSAKVFSNIKYNFSIIGGLIFIIIAFLKL